MAHQDLTCPYCGKVFMSAAPTGSGVRFKVRCQTTTCRHRMTVVEHIDAVTSLLRLEVITSRADREADKEDKLVDLDSRSIVEITAYLSARERDCDLYVSSWDDEAQKLTRYLNLRRRKEEEKLAQRKKVEEAANLATKATKAKVEEVKGLSPEQVRFRDSCMVFLNIRVQKGKVSPADAAEWVRQANRGLAGLNQLAERLGLDTIL